MKSGEYANLNTIIVGHMAISEQMTSRQSTLHEPAAFTESETRFDDMHQAIETWVTELDDLVNEAAASSQFQDWLDVQAQFHDYSYRNTILIQQQHPGATRVAGYRTWQREFNRHVKEGERAIWILAPIITQRCPECANSPRYHDQSDCEYDETPPDAWSKGLVGFKPAPVFDVSQTEGDPLPDLETAASGDAADLLPRVQAAAEEFGVTVRIVAADAWDYGETKGVCQQRSLANARPLVEVKDRANEADLVRTLIHEYAHAVLHFDVDDETERAKREVEAEAVAYIVGRYFGLDTSGSAFYLAAWESDDAAGVGNRLDRISNTAEEFIDVLEKPD